MYYLVSISIIREATGGVLACLVGVRTTRARAPQAQAPSEPKIRWSQKLMRLDKEAGSARLGLGSLRPKKT